MANYRTERMELIAPVPTQDPAQWVVKATLRRTDGEGVREFLWATFSDVPPDYPHICEQIVDDLDPDTFDDQTCQ